MNGLGLGRVYGWLAGVALGLLVVSCATHRAVGEKPTVATTGEIVSSPERFDGARVLVKGFLLQPMVGEVAIHQIEPGAQRAQPDAGIRLELDPRERNLVPFQLKLCVVEGVFHASHARGARNWIGEITRLELAE
jgi:hypothetical protein